MITLALLSQLERKKSITYRIQDGELSFYDTSYYGGYFISMFILEMVLILSLVSLLMDVFGNSSSIIFFKLDTGFLLTLVVGLVIFLGISIFLAFTGKKYNTEEAFVVNLSTFQYSYMGTKGYIQKSKFNMVSLPPTMFANGFRYVELFKLDATKKWENVTKLKFIHSSEESQIFIQTMRKQCEVDIAYSITYSEPSNFSDYYTKGGGQLNKITSNRINPEILRLHIGKKYTGLFFNLLRFIGIGLFVNIPVLLIALAFEGLDMLLISERPSEFDPIIISTFYLVNVLLIWILIFTAIDDNNHEILIDIDTKRRRLEVFGESIPVSNSAVIEKKTVEGDYRNFIELHLRDDETTIPLPLLENEEILEEFTEILADYFDLEVIQIDH